MFCQSKTSADSIHGVRDASDDRKTRTMLEHARFTNMEEQIIESVRKREILYNYKLKEYKHAVKKQEAWQEIASELNLTATDCKNKWNLLRNAFIHAMSRRKTITGQGVKNFKKWKYEEEMAFLLPHLTNRNTIASPIGEFAFDDNVNKVEKKRHTDYHEHIIDLMKERAQRRTEKNDIDLFFDSIAETVKKFPKLEQVKLKLNIMNMVNQVEIKICLESEGTSTPKSYNHNKFSPQSFSPSPQNYDTNCARSPPATSTPFVPLSRTAFLPSPVSQQVSSLQSATQWPPSPQLTYSPPPPLTQQVSSPQSSPSTLVPNHSPSPGTQQASSPQFITHSSSSTLISHHSPSPDIQQVPCPQFETQPSPSTLSSYDSPSHGSQQASSSKFVPSYLPPSTQISLHAPSSPNIQSPASQVRYVQLHRHIPHRLHKGPAHAVLKEFLIMKKQRK